MAHTHTVNFSPSSPSTLQGSCSEQKTDKSRFICVESLFFLFLSRTSNVSKKCGGGGDFNLVIEVKKKRERERERERGEVFSPLPRSSCRSRTLPLLLRRPTGPWWTPPPPPPPRTRPPPTSQGEAKEQRYGDKKKTHIFSLPNPPLLRKHLV